jgi:hypothetical protein
LPETTDINACIVSYYLDIRLPGAAPSRNVINGKLTIGSSAQADVTLADFGLAPIQLTFRVQNDVITLQNRMDKTPTCLGQRELGQGKMYILDKSDQLSVGELKFIIRKNIINKEDQKLTPSSESSIQRVINLSGQQSSDGDYDDESIAEEKVSLFKRLFGRKTKPTSKNKKKPQSKGKQPKLATNSKKSKKPKSSKKLVSYEDKANTAGVIPRLLSMLGQVSLVYALIYFILPTLELESLILPHIEKYGLLVSRSISPYVIKLIAMLPEGIAKEIGPILNIYELVQFYLLYVLIDILGSLLFSTNIPLFLSGITTPGSLISKRIKGFIRACIGAITTPFLIFDILVLFGGISLKEILSGGRLQFRHSTFRLISVIILPIFIIVAILSPLIPHIKKFNKSIITSVDNSAQKKRKQVAGSIDKPLDMPVFHMQLKNKLDDSVLVLPLFKNNKKQKLKHIYMIDQSSNQVLTFGEDNQVKINWYEIIEKAKKGNPLFHFQFPHWAEAINKKQESMKLKDNKPDNAEIKDLLQTNMNPLMESELSKMLEMAYTLDINNLSDYLMQNGPFVSGTLLLRQALDDALKINENSELVLTHIGSSLFLKSKQLSTKGRTEEKIVTRFVPISPIVAPVFISKTFSKNKDVIKIFELRFLNNAKWKWSSKDMIFDRFILLNQDQVKWTAYHVLDYFDYVVTDVKYSDEIRKRPYFFYLELAGKLFNLPDGEVRTAFIKSLASMKTNYEALKLDDQIELNQKLKILYDNYKSKNQAFFPRSPQ